jgi:hypothetical protein
MSPGCPVDGFTGLSTAGVLDSSIDSQTPLVADHWYDPNTSPSVGFAGKSKAIV